MDIINSTAYLFNDESRGISVALPKAWLNGVGLSEGSRVEFQINDDALLIKGNTLVIRKKNDDQWIRTPSYLCRRRVLHT